MLKKYGIIILICLVVILTFCYTDLVSLIYGDEIWSYGFSYNISSGLVPYRDFNVIVTPLYFFINALFLNIIGDYLFILHIFDAILVGIIIYILYKLIGYKAFIIWPIIIFFCPVSYNLLCVFWVYIIIYLVNKDEDKDILMGIIVSLLFLTKQSIGGVIFLISLYYSKSKLKHLVSFMIPIFILLIYLIYNNALYEFIDYAFLGMLDFGEKNSNFNIFVLIEIIILIYLLISLIRNKENRKGLMYIIMFQVMIYPIFDFYHFMISFSPVVYYFIKNICNKFLIIIFSFSVIFMFIGFSDFGNIDICLEDNYMFLRNYSNVKEINLDKQVDIINNYDSDYEFYILYNAYLLKLYDNKVINKFDILNNGNMGYNGSNKYIKEMSSICNENDCIFYVDYNIKNNKVTQFNRDIFNYVINNYNKIDSYEYFDVYSNR